MKICILDDTEYVLDLLSERLKGHEVCVFSNPERFLEAINSDIDVIITDLRVARYDALKHIRKFKEKNIAVKVIVMSAYFTEEILLSLIDCHVYKAVKKTHELQWFDDVANAVKK